MTRNAPSSAVRGAVRGPVLARVPARIRARVPVRGLVGAAAVLGCLLSAAGCGIKPTDVIQSGQPATVTVLTQEDHAQAVYFLGPSGELLPVMFYDVAPPTPTDVLKRLLRGPGPGEQAAGLRTEVPVANITVGVGPEVETLEPGARRARLPFPVRKLSANAQRQLVCTIARAEPSGTSEVVLAGPDGELDPARCMVG
ncbi:hypothetical protein [Streptomyces bambusae]|uniref:GerMN domain-containing protein n=1 Tax=Streptomyces bambusae TaxID=1550616 RepID=A0ABS6Z2G1_9ACTN|nr:hypothetical protein [Streptomyces bambusae]MBW5481935.1 hypothetical protein [Streptomyces bambusae]